MILASVKFGTLRGKERRELEDVADGYLTSLFKAGQICGSRFLTWTKGKLVAHVLLAAPDAALPKHHSSRGKRDHARIVELFGREPEWQIMDDEAGARVPKYKGAPFLYLFTNWVDWTPPVCRPDKKLSKTLPVPSFTLPVEYQVKEDLYHWQKTYRRLDAIWMESKALEIPAYRQLAEVKSELSIEGRRLCAAVESGTGIPTFYYLMRYYARSKGEEERLCPGCGGEWRTTVDGDLVAGFCDFHFRCDACRLVSHLGRSLDGARLARIGA